MTAEQSETVDPETSVPESDGLKTSKNNRGRGTRSMYHYHSKWYYLVEVLKAYKWPLVLLTVVILGLLAWRGLPTIPSLPSELWGYLFYAAAGSWFVVPAGWILIKKWEQRRGVEVADLDPASGDHRHLRVGTKLWERIEVRSPWGGEASVEDLNRCSINGRQGYELMDLRIREDGTPVCVATWMGEASSAALRTYRYTLVYSRRRLARQAEKAQILEANREHIIREIAERQVFRMIKTAEKSGLPDGDSIDSTVDDVLRDLGIEDRLLDEDVEDDLDVDEIENIEDWEPGPPGDEATNGHSNGAAKIKELIGK